METFFIVWNPKGRNPLFRHDAAVKAKAEAERLCRENPSDTFYVLEALGSVSNKPVVQPTWDAAINMPF